MSDGSEPVSPGAGKPTRRLWRLRVPYANIASVVLCSSMAAGIIVLDLWPPDPSRFLRLAATSATYRPYGHGLGAGLAAYMGWQVLTMKRPDRKKFPMVEAVEFFVGLVSSAAVGFYVGWVAVTFWLPFAQHVLSSKQDVEYRFTLTGETVGRPCHGVIGVIRHSTTMNSAASA